MTGLKTRLKEQSVIFFKGILMGASDVVPGVSGGTIAFITGIYERLIEGIKNITNFVNPLLKGNIKKASNEIFRIDFPFFIPLGLGIMIAFALGSRIIPYLMDNHPAFIFSFFFGLILASIKLVYKKVGKFSPSAVFFGCVGFMLSFLIVDLNNSLQSHTLPIIFFSGFIAICAMLLPGISGSFILLMLGQYRFMLDSLREIASRYMTVLAFAFGAVLGLLVFSRVMSYLLRKHHSSTMLFLIGLMLGALRVPGEQVFLVGKLHPELGFVWTPLAVIGALLLASFGVVLVLMIGKYDPENTNAKKGW